LRPLEQLTNKFKPSSIQVRNWWGFNTVNALRIKYYADWEGMHATPSEIALTQTAYRVVAPGIAETPPEKLSSEYLKAHSGDRHGPPAQHRKQFPDGRVGSHSALATPIQGEALLQAAVVAVAEDYLNLLESEN
jgi:creatinine amidohydrolase